MLCLACAAAATFYVFQLPGGGPPLVASLLLQRSARAAACRPPTSLVPGSYQADPVQRLGDYVVVTYSAQCQEPGRPAQSLDGFEARARQSGCGGQGLGPITGQPGTSGPTTVEVQSVGSCGSGPGIETLTLARGRVAGSGASAAMTAEVEFANGDHASAPVQNGRFTVLVLTASAACQVRVLDAAGSVLAEDRVDMATPGSCP